MIVKHGGRWVNGIGRFVKLGGRWRPAIRIQIKVNGRWADLVSVIVAQLWDTTITVGSNINGTLHGYNTVWGSTYGVSSAPSILAGNTVESFLTGSSSNLGVGPFQWLELCVVGKVPDMSLRTIYVNGIVGQNIRNFRSGNRTYFQWVFPTPIPLTARWAVIV